MRLPVDVLCICKVVCVSISLRFSMIQDLIWNTVMGQHSALTSYLSFVFFTCPQNEQVHPTSGHMSSHALTDFNGFTHQCDPSPIVAMGFSWTTSPYSPLMFSPGIDVCIQRHIANMALPGLILLELYNTSLIWKHWGIHCSVVPCQQ